jgi:tRNA G46 methylase TrmB
MRWRRLRWKTRIKWQKAYDTLYKELANGAEHVVIAYGGGKGQSQLERTSTDAEQTSFLGIETKNKVQISS